MQSTFRLDVDVIDISYLTFHEKTKQVRNASIVISPCGGMSFSSVFLPAGIVAMAMFPGCWDPVANSSANKEEPLGVYIQQIHILQHNVLQCGLR